MKSFFISIFIFIGIILPYKAEASHIDLKPCIKVSHCVREELNAEGINEPLSRIQSILEKTPRTKIVDIDGDYIHAESTSRIMKYVDDVEITFKEPENKLTIRSESRVGEGDFGVNQKRVDMLKSKFFEYKD
tara:strand:- start:225 stop:620 length:396 start_codon:yes stop_codon:yes gene_type:complete